MRKGTGKRFIWLTSISMVLLLGFNMTAWAQSSSEKESISRDVIFENGEATGSIQFENTPAPDGGIVSISLDEDLADTDDIQASGTDDDTDTGTNSILASGAEDDTTTGTDSTQTSEESSSDSETSTAATSLKTSEIVEGVFWLIVFGAALFASIIISRNRRR